MQVVDVDVAAAKTKKYHGEAKDDVGLCIDATCKSKNATTISL